MRNLVSFIAVLNNFVQILYIRCFCNVLTRFVHLIEHYRNFSNSSVRRDVKIVITNIDGKSNEVNCFFLIKVQVENLQLCSPATFFFLYLIENIFWLKTCLKQES